jgi:hypothetical protein
LNGGEWEREGVEGERRGRAGGTDGLNDHIVLTQLSARKAESLEFVSFSLDAMNEGNQLISPPVQDSK